MDEWGNFNGNVEKILLLYVCPIFTFLIINCHQAQQSSISKFP